MLAVVVVVNLLTLTHSQHTDLGYSFVANFHYRLIREAVIFATFSAAGMGSAYTRDGLYASIYDMYMSILASRHGCICV